MQIKNPYRRDDHRGAFDLAIELVGQGLDYPEIAKRLDRAIPREKRKQIAAKAVRLYKWNTDRV